MVDPQRNLERLQPLLCRLTAAVAANDATEFERVLDDIIHARRKDLFAQLRRMTAHVRGALQVLQNNVRLSDLAEKELPDARARLTHVLKLTAEAANTTMDLIEQSAPLVDVIASTADDEPGVTSSRAISKAALQLRHNLSDMLLAQSYQDLTGQIVRHVVGLVSEIEAVLSRLVEASGDVVVDPLAGEPAAKTMFGPAIPGIDVDKTVATQQDVDALLDGLGL